MIRSSNPALGEGTFDVRTRRGEERMTLSGVVQKSATLTLLVFFCATWIWQKYAPLVTAEFVPEEMTYWILGGALAAFVVAMITIFNQTMSPFLAPIYAVLEGLSLGAISVIFEAKYEGIVFQAIGLTFGTLLALLFAYSTGVIKPTENFKLGVVAATGGICLIYLATLALQIFGIHVPFIHESGWGGIAFSVFVVIIAALNLVLDFDFIEEGVRVGAPKYMEWYASFGLLVTLVWLYLEFLRLLAKARSGSDD
jgi:uncharacterized YccA/Bax inhibitor family protein